MTYTKRVVCPKCGRTVAARWKPGGWRMWRHMKVLAGTRAAEFGPSVLCPGSGRLAS